MFRISNLVFVGWCPKDWETYISSFFSDFGVVDKYGLVCDEYHKELLEAIEHHCSLKEIPFCKEVEVENPLFQSFDELAKDLPTTAKRFKKQSKLDSARFSDGKDAFITEEEDFFLEDEDELLDMIFYYFGNFVERLEEEIFRLNRDISFFNKDVEGTFIHRVLTKINAKYDLELEVYTLNVEDDGFKSNLHWVIMIKKLAENAGGDSCHCENSLNEVMNELEKYKDFQEKLDFMTEGPYLCSLAVRTCL